MRRQLVSVGVAVALAVGLFVATQGPTVAQGQQFAGVTITIATQSSQWADAFKKLAPEWEQKTGAKVNFVDIPYGNQYENLMSKYIANTYAYDMVWHDSQWVPEFAKRGFLTDLTPLLDDKTLTPANYGYPQEFFPVNVYISGNFKPGNKYNLPTGIWGIPLIAGWNVLYYRTDLLKAAGYSRPPDTMDELVAYVKKLNNPGKGVYGYVMSAGRPRINYDWSQWLWTYGGDYFDGKMKPIFNSPAGVRSLQTYIELGKYAPRGAANYHITEVWTTFMEGKAALTVTWQDLASVAVKPGSSVAGKIKAAPFPAVSGKRRPLVGGIVADIPKAAKNPNAAWSFLTYITSPENAVRTIKLGAYGLRMKPWNDPEVEKIAPSAAGDLEVKSLELAQPTPLIPEWAQVDQIIAEEIHAAFTGQKSAKAALDAAAAKVERVMRQAGYYK